MKSFKLLCLFCLTLVLTSSCSRIVTTDYEKVDRAVITQVDATTHCLGLHSLENGKNKNLFVSNALYDNLSWTLLEYTQQLHLGDTVFIYNTGYRFIASKVSIEDAKIVNRELSHYYWQNVLSNRYLFLLLAVCMATFGWGYFLHSPNGKKVFKPMFAGIIILFAAVYIFGGSGRTLHYLQEGVITQISDKKVELNHNTLCCVASLKDFCSDDTLNVGDRITLYNYADGQQSIDVLLPSSKKLSPETIDYWRIYPEIALMTTGWFLLLCLIMSFLLIYLRGVIRGIREG